MDKEFQVLDYISKDEAMTQRKLAQKTGLSLGSSNILIKRLVKKGLIKVEQINSRALRYILTPAGIMEKTRRTYDFLVYSYKYITSINKKIKEAVLCEINIQKFYIFGENDEVHDIIVSAMKEMGITAEDMDFEILHSENISLEQCLVFIWDLEKGIILKEKEIKFINILYI